MKKRFLALAAAAAIAASSMAAVVQADGDITVTLDDKPIEFTDVKPQIVEGDRTVVPFRAIFEALGYTVGWDEPTQTVTGVKGDIKLDMVIGKTEATLTNTADTNAETAVKTVTFDVPAQIIDDRTVVPVRAVAEMRGYTVDWEQDTQTVVITSPADIITDPGPVVPESSEAPAASAEPDATAYPAASAEPDASASPAASAEPSATASPAASAEPNATAAPAKPTGDLPISYDLRSEDGQGNVRNFELITAEKNADGKYDITFKFETMQEGPGSVDAHFNCLDASGKVIDEFGGSYPSRDYTWTSQESKATISGDTVKIELQKK